VRRDAVFAFSSLDLTWTIPLLFQRNITGGIRDLGSSRWPPEVGNWRSIGSRGRGQGRHMSAKSTGSTNLGSRE